MGDDRQCFTLVFEGDITKFKGNPLKTETPFGIPFAAGLGDALRKLDGLDEVEEAAKKFLAAIARWEGGFDDPVGPALNPQKTPQHPGASSHPADSAGAETGGGK